ncbi:MAG: RluA family pseudouridine synthase [Bacteroidota bacterium]
MDFDLSGLQVIYEDNHLIGVNKPSRILVHGDATGDTPLTAYVKQYIKMRYQKPGDVFLGVVHRLDRPVSGAIIFARTSKGLSRMQKVFAERKVQKTYWAISKNRPEPLEGSLKNYLVKDTTKHIVKILERPSRRYPNAKLANLNYKMIAEVSGNHLIEVNPITGRPHQIRVQLAQIGCTIVGDVKYGYSRHQWKGNINLHCRSMAFIHPVKKEPVTITAAPPTHDQIWDMFEDSGLW